MLNVPNHSSYVVNMILQPTRVVNMWLPQNLQSYLYPNSRASEIYHGNTVRQTRQQKEQQRQGTDIHLGPST